MSQLDKKIIHTYREAQRKKKIQEHLTHLGGKIAGQSEQLKQMDGELQQLGYSLGWMESAPLQKIKEWLWGQEDCVKEQEQMKSRYFKKIMHYKALIKERELCQYEYDVLASQLEKIKDTKVELRKLLRQKEEELIEAHEETAQEILEVRNEMVYQKLLIEEMDEATVFGEKAKNILEIMIQDLKRVKSFDRFEMYGQGRYSSTSKLAYIEKAQDDIDMAYNWLQRFNRELKDISVRQKVDYYDELDQFEQFIDVLYEALLSSSMIHASIDNSIIRLSQVHKKLERSLGQLHGDIELSERTIKRLSSKINLLIVKKASKSDLQSDEQE